MNMQISIYQFVRIIMFSRAVGRTFLKIIIAIFYVILTVNSNSGFRVSRLVKEQYLAVLHGSFLCKGE